jgi:guanine deaminase
MNTPGDLRRIFKAFVMNPVVAGRVDTYGPGFLVVNGGKIERLSSHDPRPDLPPAEFIDLGKKTIVPGFVDTHLHLPQFAIMGVGVGELLTWLNDYTYPEEARFKNTDYAVRISGEFFDALVAKGTTTAVIYSSVHESATDAAFLTAQSKGIRAFIGKVMMDRNSPESLLEETADSLAASLRLFDRWDGVDDGRLRYIFTPRFAASCSMELMRRVGDIARERGAFIQSHLSENQEEVEWVRRLFPSAPSYASIYDSCGLLNERSIMAHCIHLMPDEIDLLCQRRTNVAFCPYSNRNLRSGTMPYQRLRNAGLNISLATDIAGGPSLSMLDQMREAVSAAGIPSSEALYLATLAGAKALGLSDRIGNLDSGKDADFVILNNDVVEEVYIRGRSAYQRL